MGINVLSLFDGIGCGRVALERAGIEVENSKGGIIMRKGIHDRFEFTLEGAGNKLSIKLSNLPQGLELDYVEAELKDTVENTVIPFSILNKFLLMHEGFVVEDLNSSQNFTYICHHDTYSEIVNKGLMDLDGIEWEISAYIPINMVLKVKKDSKIGKSSKIQLNKEISQGKEYYTIDEALLELYYDNFSVSYLYNDISKCDIVGKANRLRGKYYKNIKEI